MRHKPSWAVNLAPALFLVVVALRYRSPLWALSLTYRATGLGGVLAAIRQWIQMALAHLTPAQVVGGVGVAWLFFVLALVLLARCSQAELLDAESLANEYDRQHSTMVTLADPTSAGSAGGALPRLPAQSSFPALSSVWLSPPETLEAVADNAIDAAAVSQRHGNPPVGLTAVQLPAYHNAEEKLPGDSPALMRPLSTQQRNGHLLALTGVATTEQGPVPYGLFVVAQDVEATSCHGEASRQIIDVIVTQVAPSLANDATLGSEHLATMFKMAVHRASMALRYQNIRTAAALGAVVAGTIVIGQDVYVINVGHCRTYLFRPSSGLLQIGIDHSVVACLVATGLLLPEALDRHPRRDQIYRSVGGQHTTSEVDTFALRVQRDDQIILCSPGLWRSLSATEIETIVRMDADPRSTAERLTRTAHRHGSDRVSVIVVRPRGEWLPEFGVPAA